MPTQSSGELESDLLTYALMDGMSEDSARTLVSRVVAGYKHLRKLKYSNSELSRVLNDVRLDITGSETCVLCLLSGSSYSPELLLKFKLSHDTAWQYGFDIPPISYGLLKHERARVRQRLTLLWHSFYYVLNPPHVEREVPVVVS